MKKIAVVGLILFLISGIAFSAYADAGAVATKASKDKVASYRMDIGDKAARGCKNIVLGWTELPRSIMSVSKETNFAWGLLAGTFQGTLKAMARTASGVCDVVTAPLNPKGDPLVQPTIDVE
ncbi:MAG: exosortase system-associated protein, TIGR04073 family [Candidatus Omnitrophica bacterium]|nr:exosortase system-associated protein, TIGR04073 family [Candidatus Omnitrophota bacterium]